MYNIYHRVRYIALTETFIQNEFITLQHSELRYKIIKEVVIIFLRLVLT